MVSTGDLKRGMTTELGGDLLNILEYNHIKIGRGSAQERLRVSNVKTGATVERTFQAGEKFRRTILETGEVMQVPFFVNEGDRIRVDTRTGQYLERA